MTHSHAPLIGTHAGLRGRPGEGLTDEVVCAAVRRLVQLLRDESLPAEVAVARDGRPSGLRLSELVVDVLLAEGCDVVDLGLAATPTAKLVARRRSLGAAAIVTGSHLDPSWNGLKFVAAPSYAPLDVRRLPEAVPVERGPRGRLTAEPGAAAEHAAAILESVDVAAVHRAALCVSSSGGGDAVAALVLAGLGATASGALDIGLVLDADGDRLTLIDEQGRPVDPELTLPLVATARRPARIVKGADTSDAVDLAARAWGGTVRRVPTGELYLVNALLSEGGDLAGEGNGGVVVPDVGLARDGLAAAASVLELVATTGTPLSELVSTLPALARVRSAAHCPDPVRAAGALARLAGELGLELRDVNCGLRLERPDGAWALVRASGTEPLLRITTEAAEPTAAQAWHDEIRQVLLSGLEGT